VSTLLRGAMIEYGADLIGPIPNVVLFQFNPETLTRTLRIPDRPREANARERTQAGEDTWEEIGLTAHFSAADALGEDRALARAFGIGPQLAALEQMAHPTSELDGLLGQALDAIGDVLGAATGGGGGGDPAQPIPRKAHPRLLFIWGLTRVLPVTLESMRIVEREYDNLLNPLRAEVELGLVVSPPESCSDDWLARGAMEYSTLAKEAQAAANLANTAEQVVDIIPL